MKYISHCWVQAWHNCVWSYDYLAAFVALCECQVLCTYQVCWPRTSLQLNEDYGVQCHCQSMSFMLTLMLTVTVCTLLYFLVFSNIILALFTTTSMGILPRASHIEAKAIAVTNFVAWECHFTPFRGYLLTVALQWQQVEERRALIKHVMASTGWSYCMTHTRIDLDRQDI